MELNVHADEYPRWSEGMERWGYTWEPFKVTTEDGFVLTTFRVTGTKADGPFKPTKGSVLI